MIKRLLIANRGDINVINLGDRDCSMQRRNQKLIEESLSTYLDDTQRQKLYDVSLALTKGINYIGAGTIEFIVDKNKNFYFIEMNTSRTSSYRNDY